ncbi:hypothetical protein [Thiomonas sp.]
MVAQARQGIAPFFPRGAVPTAEETAKAKKDAQEVLDWLRANLAKHRAGADVAKELEDFLFNIGSIRMLWALMPDEEAAGRYLVDREALTSQTPLAVRCAFAKAESREHEERAAMFETVHNLRMTADRLQSDRLSKAADVFEQMMGFFRVEPDGPAKAGHKQAGSKGGQLSRGKSNAAKRELKRTYMAGKPAKWKTPAEAARALKKEALDTGAIKSDERWLQTLGDWFRKADRGDMG